MFLEKNTAATITSLKRQDSEDVEEKWFPYKVILVFPCTGPDFGCILEMFGLAVYLKCTPRGE